MNTQNKYNNKNILFWLSHTLWFIVTSFIIALQLFLIGCYDANYNYLFRIAILLSFSKWIIIIISTLRQIVKKILNIHILMDEDNTKNKITICLWKTDFIFIIFISIPSIIINIIVLINGVENNNIRNIIFCCNILIPLLIVMISILYELFQLSIIVCLKCTMIFGLRLTNDEDVNMNEEI